MGGNDAGYRRSRQRLGRRARRSLCRSFRAPRELDKLARAPQAHVSHHGLYKVFADAVLCWIVPQTATYLTYLPAPLSGRVNPIPWRHFNQLPRANQHDLTEPEAQFLQSCSRRWLRVTTTRESMPICFSRTEAPPGFLGPTTRSSPAARFISSSRESERFQLSSDIGVTIPVVPIIEIPPRIPSRAL